MRFLTAPDTSTPPSPPQKETTGWWATVWCMPRSLDQHSDTATRLPGQTSIILNVAHSFVFVQLRDGLGTKSRPYPSDVG